MASIHPPWLEHYVDRTTDPPLEAFPFDAPDDNTCFQAATAYLVLGFCNNLLAEGRIDDLWNMPVPGQTPTRTPLMKQLTDTIENIVLSGVETDSGTARLQVARDNIRLLSYHQAPAIRQAIALFTEIEAKPESHAQPKIIRSAPLDSEVAEFTQRMA